jgi:hypothetical protein
VFFGAESSDETFLYFPLQNLDGVLRVRRADWGVEALVRVAGSGCSLPHEISLGPDGRYYLVCEGNHVDPSRVLSLDPTTLDVLGRFDVGVYPDRIVFVPGSAP